MSIESSYDPNEARRDAMMDGSGFSNYLADERHGDESLHVAEESIPVQRKTSKRRPSGYVRVWGDTAPRDGELSVNQSTGPLTPEQRISLAHGMSLAEKAIADNVIKSICDKVDREIPLDDYDIPKSLAAREKEKTRLIGNYFAEREAKKAARAERVAKLKDQ